MDARTHACTHGWMDGRMDGCMYVHSLKLSIYIYIQIVSTVSKPTYICGTQAIDDVEPEVFDGRFKS